jgi:MurNAc alpha-1-phosphate uridylyltransferase
VVPLQKHFMAQGRIRGQHYRGQWTDVGTPQRLQALEDALRADAGPLPAR